MCSGRKPLTYKTSNQIKQKELTKTSMMISTLWSPWTVHQYSSAVRARLGGGGLCVGNYLLLETIYLQRN